MNPSGLAGSQGSLASAEHKLAICEGVLRLGSFVADLKAASTAGYTLMQVEAGRIEEAGTEAAARMLADFGMAISSLGTISGPFGSSDDDKLLRSIDIAATLGTSLVAIVPGSLGDMSHQEAADRTRTWLSKHGRRAAASGVALALEPIHPLLRHITWVHTLRQGAALVAGIEGACLLVDVGHLWWDPDLIPEFQTNVDLIKLVQVTNVDRVALSDGRYERSALGAGDVPVLQLVRAFHEAGYRGYYEHEVRTRMPREDRVGFARSEREWFAAQLGDRLTK